MAEKTLNARVITKNDTKANWDKATNFVPKKGELIIYTDLLKVKVGDGATSVIDLPYANENGELHFVEGPTSDTTAGAWTGTIDGLKEYYDGLAVIYVPRVAGATITTLNINDLGAKQCYRQAASTITTHYAANSAIFFVYRNSLNNGNGGWQSSAYYDSTDLQSLRPNYARYYMGQYPLYSYKICVIGADGRLLPLSLEKGTGTGKTQLPLPFRPDMLYYYNTTTDVAANGIVAAGVIYYAYNHTTAHYTFNSTTPTYHTIYLVGSFDSATGLFTLDQTDKTSWYKFVPYNSTFTKDEDYFEEGKYYIYVGRSYSSTNYYGVEMYNPMYYFDGHNLVFTNTAAERALDKFGSLAAVAESGSYNDLKDKPTIPTDVVSHYGDITPTHLAQFGADGSVIGDSGLDPAKIALKSENVHFVKGPATDTTAGTWTGTIDGLTSYYEGLVVVYIPHVAGASTTKLNINGLGAKLCTWRDAAKMSTQYAVGSAICMVYRNDLNNNTGGFQALSDYYQSNTNQTLKVGTTTFGANDAVELVAGDNVTLTPNATSKTITISTESSSGDTYLYSYLNVDQNKPCYNTGTTWHWGYYVSGAEIPFTPDTFKPIMLKKIKYNNVVYANGTCRGVAIESKTNHNKAVRFDILLNSVWRTVALAIFTNNPDPSTSHTRYEYRVLMSYNTEWDLMDCNEVGIVLIDISLDGDIQLSGNTEIYIEIPEEPVVDVITFSISGVNYSAANGMTWGEWLISKYNTSSIAFTWPNTTIAAITATGGDYLYNTNYEEQTLATLIESGHLYLIE